MLETTPAAPPRHRESFAPVDALPADFLVDWEPRPLARAIRSGRRFRWPVIVVTLVVATAASAGIHAGLRYPDRHVHQRSTEYVLAAGHTAAALAEATVATVAITDAGATTAEITAAIDPLVRLELAAADLQEVSSQWVLDLPDQVPVPALDDLVRARARLRAAAGGITDVTERLRSVADYRIGVAGLLTLPSLPTPDNPIPAVQAQRDISAMLATAVSRLGALPDDPALRLHRDRLAELITWLGAWQSRYLAVLQVGDLDTAVGLEREAQDRIADTHLALLEPLGAIADWSDQTITSLRLRIDEAMILVDP